MPGTIQPKTQAPFVDQGAGIFHVARLRRQTTDHRRHRITRRQARNNKDQRRAQPDRNQEETDATDNITQCNATHAGFFL